jgi:hypothetical protein
MFQDVTLREPATEGSPNLQEGRFFTAGKASAVQNDSLDNGYLWQKKRFSNFVARSCTNHLFSSNLSAAHTLATPPA